MKKKTKFGIVVIIVAMIIGFYFNYKTRTNTKVDKAGQYVVANLNAKYHQNFVIEKGHYIFNTGGYEFTVYPKDDPNFKFTAWLNGMTKSGVSDKYFILSQVYEVMGWIKPYLNHISKDYYISAAAPQPQWGGKNYEKMVAVMHDQQLTIAEMLKRYPYKMRYSLTCHINYDITPQNEDAVLKKVYNLLQFLRKKKFGSIEMTLYFYNFPHRNIKRIGNEEQNLDIDYSFKAKYWLDFNPENAKSIKSYKDLKKFLRKPKVYVK